jgi:hypothetical protein
MITTIHQPELGMYLGLIDKIFKSDTFVILDTAQFEKNYWGNRFAIRTKDQTQVLTVPVEAHNHKPYNELKIDYGTNWQKKVLKSISQNYSNAPYFGVIYPIVNDIFSQQFECLSQLNITLLKKVLLYLRYPGGIVLSSQLEINPTLRSTELLVAICAKVKADTYLSGISGKDYLDLTLFQDITVGFQQFVHPTYRQVYPSFISMLSVLDAMFNCGDVLPLTT